MYLKIIWENNAENLVECSRVNIVPEGVSVTFEPVDREYRSQGLFFVRADTPRVHVFVMNNADTIENWHADRRSEILKPVSLPAE